MAWHTFNGPVYTLADFRRHRGFQVGFLIEPSGPLMMPAGGHFLFADGAYLYHWLYAGRPRRQRFFSYISLFTFLRC